MEKQTLVEQTTQRLLEMIQREGYGPGDKLPTETELVRRLGVGRNTVREALRSLASRNVVTVRQGRAPLSRRRTEWRTTPWALP